MTKQRGADRPGDEGDGEGGQRLQGGRGGIALREKDMREDDDRGSGIDVEVENSMAVPMSEATTTLLRELTGAVSCEFSSVVAVACIDLSYFARTKSHIATATGTFQSVTNVESG